MNEADVTIRRIQNWTIFHYDLGKSPSLSSWRSSKIILRRPFSQYDLNIEPNLVFISVNIEIKFYFSSDEIKDNTMRRKRVWR